ncbi:MAG: M6 family metalloprotease domain-containing protein, partial [Bacteroidota bacterium]
MELLTHSKRTTKIIYKFAIAFILLLWAATNLNAAYLEYVPTTITQPNGETIKCFASGDEFYNWLHDSSGYTIIQRADNGFYVYADKINSELVPTNLIAGKSEPAIAGIGKWLKIAPEIIKAKAEQHWNSVKKPVSKNDKLQSLSFGTINNIVVFIRFSDESEFTDPISYYNTAFNSASGNSLQSYFQEASYANLLISSTFYPTPSGTVVSYQDSHVRNYYKPYNATTNTIGYQNANESADREQTLLKDAVNAISGLVPPSLNIDMNADNKVDNVCFIIYGTQGAWSDLLWPHMWSLYGYNVSIRGKRVWDYNFQIQSMLSPNVLAHEMFHTIGAPDLYHYGSDGLNPVGPWDLMAQTANPPEHMGAYMKYRYGLWISSIPEITTPGVYNLSPISSSTNNCYKIRSPNSTTEYYVLEYRQKTGTFETSVPGSGLVVYRINSNSNGAGNSQYPTPPDEVYIYRPGGTTSTNGTITQAFMSSSSGRIAINDLTDPSPFLSNGAAGGLNISEISTAGATISFRYGTSGAISVPTLVSPTNASTGISLTPKLIWNSDIDAVSYQIQISLVADFSSTLLNQTGLTDTSYQVASALAPNTLHYWRVKKVTSGGSSNWSGAWNFTTSFAPPTLAEPVNNSTNIDPVSILRWNSVAGAFGYNLQVSTDSNFTNIVIDQANLSTLSYLTTGLLSNSKYYWHV